MSQYEEKTKTLYIGPIIALLTEVNDMEGEPIFRSIHTFCEELHYASTITGGLFYVFHIKDISEDVIEGFYFNGNNWTKSKITLPNVIYNRTHSRKLESSPYFKKVINDISLKGIPIFNERFLSKWEVHEILYKEDYLHPFLPETQLLNQENLIPFLKRHSTIFIKPINGSQGRNIFKASLQEEKVIVEASTAWGSDKYRKFDTLVDFQEWFNKRRKEVKFIIQQSIPLLTFEERQLDFRVLCHKDHQDNWKTTSIVARASEKKQFVSNLARGGEMLKPIDPLTKLFEQQTAYAQVAWMKELSLEVANIISQSSSGIVGELGIDIGVDNDGKLWIIEVNSKPSKNAEEQTSKIRPSAKSIYEYSTALAFHFLKGYRGR